MSNLSRDYIREHYNMPNLERGLLVLYDGKEGVITGFYSSYIKIKTKDGLIDGYFHPQDEKLEIKYGVKK